MVAPASHSLATVPPGALLAVGRQLPVCSTSCRPSCFSGNAASMAYHCGAKPWSLLASTSAPRPSSERTSPSRASAE